MSEKYLGIVNDGTLTTKVGAVPAIPGERPAAYTCDRFLTGRMMDAVMIKTGKT